MVSRMPASWLVERTQHPRFPFRISIEQDGRTLFAVRARSDWPAPGAQIFCLRERTFDPAEPLEFVTRVPVTQLTRVGPKLAVILDRPARKRCEFLTLTRPRKGGGGNVEQTFFRTETAIRAHRSRGRVELRAPAALEVVIDLQERYPWRFEGSRVSRRRLAIGDYALLREERILAVVERKTLGNLLADIGAIRALHHVLSELAGQERAALVIEAQYADFLDPAKTGAWPAAHVARVLAEISALHPRLPIVYAGNRKLANAWTIAWFRALAASEAQELPLFVQETLARYEPSESAASLDQRVRAAALHELADSFSASELRARFPNTPLERIRRVLSSLRREGKVLRVGHGPRRALAAGRTGVARALPSAVRDVPAKCGRCRGRASSQTRRREARGAARLDGAPPRALSKRIARLETEQEQPRRGRGRRSRNQPQAGPQQKRRMPHRVRVSATRSSAQGHVEAFGVAAPAPAAAALPAIIDDYSVSLTNTPPLTIARTFALSCSTAMSADGSPSTTSRSAQ
jgi:hypothetical protein